MGILSADKLLVTGQGESFGSAANQQWQEIPAEHNSQWCNTQVDIMADGADLVAGKWFLSFDEVNSLLESVMCLSPNQRHFSMNCPVKSTVSYDSSAGFLVFRECSLEHYPSSRDLILKS